MFSIYFVQDCRLRESQVRAELRKRELENFRVLRTI